MIIIKYNNGLYIMMYFYNTMVIMIFHVYARCLVLVCKILSSVLYFYVDIILLIIC